MAERWKLAVVLAGLCWLWITPATADQFFLANGGRIDGVLLNPEESPREHYVVQTTAGGRLTLSGDQVDRVVVKSEAEKRYEAFLPSVPDTVEGHWDVAERCERAGLDEQQQFHLERVLRIEPDHVEARHALGYSRIDGHWMRQEDLMEKQGYVRHRGSWRLPQELKLEEFADAHEKANIEWRKKLKLWSTWIVKNRGRRSEAETAIRAIRDPIAAAALYEQVQKEKEPRPLRMLYIDVLAEIGNGAGDPIFTKIALEDSDRTIRDRCLDHLSRSGSRYAVAAFEKALEHDQNLVVQRAAVGLGQIKNPSSTLPLVDALITEHKQVVGSGGGIAPSFSNQGSGLNVGGGPKVVKRKVKNEAVLSALTSIYPGVNYGFDKDGWRRWYIEHNTPKVVDLRRNQ